MSPVVDSQTLPPKMDDQQEAREFLQRWTVMVEWLEKIVNTKVHLQTDKPLQVLRDGVLLW